MNIRTIIEFNPQDLNDTYAAMDKNKELSFDCWLLPANSLVSLDCLEVLNACDYKCFKPLDYGTIIFHKEYNITEGI